MRRPKLTDEDVIMLPTEITQAKGKDHAHTERWNKKQIAYNGHKINSEAVKWNKSIVLLLVAVPACGTVSKNAKIFRDNFIRHIQAHKIRNG